MEISPAKRYQLANDQILLVEPFNPPIQIVNLLGTKIVTWIQRPVQILGQHLFIEALAREASRRIPARKVLIRTSWAVEVAPGGHVVDFPTHGEVYWCVGRAVVWQKRARCECLEDYWLRAGGESCGRGGAQAQVEEGADD